jgi:predicted transcriptional regulator of viral defense system
MAQNHVSTLLQLFESSRFVRSKDLDEFGIPRAYLSRLMERGRIRRVARGLYERTDAPSDERETLAEVCATVPRAVVSLFSAAQLYDLTVTMPHAVWISLPPGTPRPRVDFVALEITYVDPALLTGSAVQILDYFGADIRVTTPVRTVVDMFRFRSRVGLEAALETLQAYVQRNRTFDALMAEAGRLKVDKVMKPYLEALLV